MKPTRQSTKAAGDGRGGDERAETAGLVAAHETNTEPPKLVVR